MQCLTRFAAVTVSAAALALFSALSPAVAQPVPEAGIVGRIAKFVSTTEVGNSVLFESAGRIGLGTTAPSSMLDIRGGGNALQLWGSRPFLMFRDTLTGDARSIVQTSNGGLTFMGENFINGSNPLAFVRIDRNGRIGIGTANPTRAIQIGPGADPMFTIEPSDASPRAGFIRFGDRTGWQLRIGRSREFSGGPLNTGLTGALFTFRDDGAFGPTGYPLLATGVERLCRTLANFITRCEASSIRYKKDIQPYLGGLDIVERLHPISFTRIYNGRSDIGLAAEDVAQVEPRFTYPNDEGEVEGIKYDLLTAVLINAVKEQQKLLEEQTATIKEMQAAIAHLQELARTP
jgi:hypothetical protein